MKIIITTDDLLAISELSPFIQKFLIEDRERKLVNGFLEIPFTDLYENVFQLLYSKNVQMKDLRCWIEIDKKYLDYVVPETFPNCYIEEGSKARKKLRDYVISYRENETKAVIICGDNTNQQLPNSELLYSFLAKYANEDLSNCYTYAPSIKEKLKEYEKGVEL